MNGWKDVTSFAQGEKDRTPRSSEIRIADAWIVVTRIRNLRGWFADLRRLNFEQAPLVSKEIDEAQREALEEVADRLLRTYRAVCAQLGREVPS